jgi:hypothetical protein
VKWLGNIGSHPGEVERDTVFDAFDILEFILVERFATEPSVANETALQL